MADLTFIGIGVDRGGAAGWNVSTNATTYAASAAITALGYVSGSANVTPARGDHFKITTAGTETGVLGASVTTKWYDSDRIVWDGSKWIHVGDLIGNAILGGLNVPGDVASIDSTTKTMTLTNLVFGYGAGMQGNPRELSNTNIPANNNVVTYGVTAVGDGSVVDVGSGAVWVAMALP